MSERQTTPHALLLAQFVAWVGAADRSYAETMEAWRSSCPRLSVWEDALDAGLVRIDTAGAAATAEARVRLTARGEVELRAAEPATA